MANEQLGAPKPLLPAALVKAQREVQSALKSSKNEFHKYRYASAEEVLTVGRDALNNNGLSLSPLSETMVPLPAGITDSAAACLLFARYTLEHESGEHREIEMHVPVVPEKGRPLDKALFGARTESLGYALRDLLLIPRVDAPDVSGRADRPQRAQEPARQPPKSNGPQNAEGENTIEDAIALAFGRAVAGATQDERKVTYASAKQQLTDWCKAHGKTKEEHDAAQAEVVRRCKAASPKPTTPADPAVTDAEHARRIDEGKA